MCSRPSSEMGGICSTMWSQKYVPSGTKAHEWPANTAIGLDELTKYPVMSVELPPGAYKHKNNFGKVGVHISSYFLSGVPYPTFLNNQKLRKPVCNLFFVCFYVYTLNAFTHSLHCSACAYQ